MQLVLQAFNMYFMPACPELQVLHEQAEGLHLL